MISNSDVIFVLFSFISCRAVLLWIIRALDSGQLLVPWCSVPAVAVPRLGDAMRWGQAVAVGQELDCLELLQGILPHSGG